MRNKGAFSKSVSQNYLFLLYISLPIGFEYQKRVHRRIMFLNLEISSLIGDLNFVKYSVNSYVTTTLQPIQTTMRPPLKYACSHSLLFYSFLPHPIPSFLIHTVFFMCIISSTLSQIFIEI